jgi:hypothetical protein
MWGYIVVQQRLSGGSGRECILGGGRRGNWGLGCIIIIMYVYLHNRNLY